MQTLKLIIFKDGRPGHEKQTEGLVAALADYVNLDITAFEVPRKSVFFEVKAYIDFFLRQLNSPCTEYRPDLIIGTGSRTHIAVLTCKRESGAKAVICMAPNTLLRDYFDLCLVPIHDRLPNAENIFATIGPPNNSRNWAKHRTDSGLILIGGVDHKSHFWDEDKIIENIEEIITRADIKNWIISSSPRTPSETEKKLVKLASKKPHVNFCSFFNTEKGWIDQQYNENKMVWITADSISMVYEALSAGCRVGILPVKWKGQRSKFQYSERYLIDRKRVISFSDWRGGRTQWSEESSFNEADRCAREILKRWWPENIP